MAVPRVLAVIFEYGWDEERRVVKVVELSLAMDGQGRLKATSQSTHIAKAYPISYC